jgi:hypothetical protein
MTTIPERIRTSGGTRCRLCGKAIVWPGLCYTCATGLPRTIKRRSTPDGGFVVEMGVRWGRSRQSVFVRGARHYVEKGRQQDQDHAEGANGQQGTEEEVRSMPRHYIDEEWDRDALFTTRNLVTPEYAAEHLKVTSRTVEKSAGREQGSLLVWVFGGRGSTMRKYHEVYIDMGPRPGPDTPHAWQGYSPEVLLGEARQQYAHLEGRPK